jgi:hypothetical protein
MVGFNPNFTEVTRAQSKASVVIQGLSGKGKSGLALTMALVLADESWANVFCLDTENRSLDLFEGISTHIGIPFGKFKKFDLLRIHGFRPSHYTTSKEHAKAAGALVFVQDSITHAWNGPSGVLQLVSQKERENSKVNKFNAWGEAEVMFEKDNIFEMIRDPDVHMISTVRVKEKHEMVTGEGIKSLGEQQIQMPDLKYEPDLVLDMIHSGTTTGRPPRAKVIKSRYAIFSEGEVYDFTLEVLQQLKTYLAEGADPAIIMEQQRQEMLREIKYILDSSTSKQAVWTVLKAQEQVTDVLLEDLPLNVARKLLSRLIGG